MANPRCKICIRSDRSTIDKKIAAGVSYRRIGSEFGLSLGLLSRHRPHITQEIQTLVAAERNTERVSSLAGGLLERLETVIAEAQSICAEAKAAKSYASAVSALNAVTRNLQLVGRITGELQSNSGGIHVTQVNVNVGAYDDDVQFAAMIGEATKGFSVEELMRLKALAEGTAATPSIDIPGPVPEKNQRREPVEGFIY